MRLGTIFSGAFFGALLLGVVAPAESPNLRWVRHLDEARRLATAERKDLLINFTGLEWCGHCMDLDREILSQKEFAPAANDFVLVDIDFPSDRGELGPLKEPYDKWYKQYLAQGCPTVVLADAAGRPYAYFSGYDDADDVAKYLAKVNTAHQRRQTRDRELAAAAKSTGAERAQKLHAAILAIVDQLEELEELEDDPVLVFYGDEVAEIRRLDADDALKLRSFYDARIAKRDAFRKRRALLASLDEFYKSQDWPAALAAVDKALLETSDERTHFELLTYRAGFLEEGNKKEEAVAVMRALQTHPAAAKEERDRYVRNEAICLYQMGRVDDAVACYDRALAATRDRDSLLYLLDWKMNLLLGSKRPAETIAACQALREAAKPNSKEWAQATLFIANEFEKSKQYREAIAMTREAIVYWRRDPCIHADCLMTIAKNQHALGEVGEAGRTLDDAEQAIPAPGDRPAKNKEIQRVREELKEARRSLAPATDK